VTPRTSVMPAGIAVWPRMTQASQVFPLGASGRSRMRYGASPFCGTTSEPRAPVTSPVGASATMRAPGIAASAAP
jgi:hypothetical protein